MKAALLLLMIFAQSTFADTGYVGLKGDVTSIRESGHEVIIGVHVRELLSESKDFVKADFEADVVVDASLFEKQDARVSDSVIVRFENPTPQVRGETLRASRVLNNGNGQAIYGVHGTVVSRKDEIDQVVFVIELKSYTTLFRDEIKSKEQVSVKFVKSHVPDYVGSGTGVNIVLESNPTTLFEPLLGKLLFTY